MAAHKHSHKESLMPQIMLEEEDEIKDLCMRAFEQQFESLLSGKKKHAIKPLYDKLKEEELHCDPLELKLFYEAVSRDDSKWKVIDADNNFLLRTKCLCAIKKCLACVEKWEQNPLVLSENNPPTSYRNLVKSPGYFVYFILALNIISVIISVSYQYHFMYQT